MGQLQPLVFLDECASKSAKCKVRMKKLGVLWGGVHAQHLLSPRWLGTRSPSFRALVPLLLLDVRLPIVVPLGALTEGMSRNAAVEAGQVLALTFGLTGLGC